MHMNRAGPALATLLLAATAAGAQQSATESTTAESTPDGISVGWSYGIWGGFARNSPTNIWGAERGRDVAFGGVRLMRYHPSASRVALDYYIDIVPAAWMSPPRVAGPPPCGSRYLTAAGGPVTCVLDPPAKTTAFGFGGAPMGTQLRVRLTDDVQPYIAANAGMLWFARPVPSERAAQLNFTADAGAGLLIGHHRRMRLMIGYRYQHISNGGTARSNPGVDGHMLFAGIIRMPR